MLFEALLFAVAILGGAVAAVAGFGAGSLLTPLLTVQTGAKLAVAAVAIPHLAGTTLRLWYLRRDVNHRVLWTFGLTNAAGGLVGALLHAYVQSEAIRVIFGCVLVAAGVMGLTGAAQRLRFHGRRAWLAGIVAGGLGGFAGTQGGIRAAALLGFDLTKKQFVATATAIALLVDGARTPVYVWSQWDQLRAAWPLILVAAAGILVGTLVGGRVLQRIPERYFRPLVSLLLIVLGLAMVFVIEPGRR